MYIVSPKDIVVARKRDQDDHVSWLLQNGMYEEALDEVDRFGKQLKKHTFLVILLSFSKSINHLYVKMYSCTLFFCIFPNTLFYPNTVPDSFLLRIYECLLCI